MSRFNDALDDSAARIRRSLDELRTQFARTRDEAKRQTDELRQRLGLPPDDGARTIDVGGRPSALSRLKRATLALLAVAFAVAALLSLGIFCVQVLCAFLLLQRGLGIRIDVTPRPA